MFRDYILQVVWNKMVQNSSIAFQCMDNAGNKTWEFFIRKDICAYTAGKAQCCSKYMNLTYLVGCRINQKFRLITDPVDKIIHLVR